MRDRTAGSQQQGRRARTRRARPVPLPRHPHRRLPVSESRRHGRQGQPRVRRREENQRLQATYRRRHQGYAGGGNGDSRGHDRPGRRPRNALAPAPHASPAHPKCGPTPHAPASSSTGPAIPPHHPQDRLPARGAEGFVVLPRRWKVERTLGWIMHARRNVRDYERLTHHSEAHPTWSLIALMTRRPTRTAAAQKAAGRR